MKYDVCVVGGGHAGCEAALACARMGMKTLLFAINLDSIAMMPCNPNIGGTSKGHIVREIDALGGEMGKNIDKTFIQSRMLNTSKGPAVYSLRAQADKRRYSNEMKRTLEREENLEIRQSEIVDIIVGDGSIRGVMTESGIEIRCCAVVLCTGTYLKARCLYGETIVQSGPNGLRSSVKLSESLRALGIRLFRFKTGTPARIDKKSIDFSKMKVQHGDEKIVPFSFENDSDAIKREQVPCHLTYTNSETHRIIKENLSKSPLYMGVIEGTGTRYCPSIEDKVVRFPDKDSHQVFIEPEGEDTDEMYVQGMSTSLPESVQIEMYRSIAGLENCRFMRPGYAIEYDCIDATQLKLSLEFKDIGGLFSAGQFNGSSGYEEAAGQGIIAGINAALYVKGKEPLALNRADGYIGVLIDDLVTKGSNEPYRMMTSRAEYRLLLRQDNADIRLLEKGYAVGLIPEDRYRRFLIKREAIEREIKRIGRTVVTPSDELNEFLEGRGSTKISTGVKLVDLVKRPELDYKSLAQFDAEYDSSLGEQVIEQISISVKYEGYIKLQIEQIERMIKIESKTIPKDFNYEGVKSISAEARQKLKRIRPENVGQAGRIAGVSPADVSMLLICLRDIH